MYKKIISTANITTSKILIVLISIYRYLISPALGSCCRYQPTCSEYAKHAIKKHGVFRGCLLAAQRLLRCHPLHKGGFDPVPEIKQAASTKR